MHLLFAIQNSRLWHLYLYVRNFWTMYVVCLFVQKHRKRISTITRSEKLSPSQEVSLRQIFTTEPPKNTFRQWFSNLCQPAEYTATHIPARCWFQLRFRLLRHFRCHKTKNSRRICYRHWHAWPEGDEMLFQACSLCACVLFVSVWRCIFPPAHSCTYTERMSINWVGMNYASSVHLMNLSLFCIAKYARSFALCNYHPTSAKLIPSLPFACKNMQRQSIWIAIGAVQYCTLIPLMPALSICRLLHKSNACCSYTSLNTIM